MDARAPTISPAPLTTSEQRAIISGVLLTMALAAIEQTIVATALTTIGRQLGDIEHLSWVVTAYLLSATAATTLYGKLSDIHGRRVVMLTAIAIFMVGSAACALAPNMLALIFARALQGLGGGGLLSLAHAIIGDAVPPRERPRFQVHIATVWASAGLAGPVLGGAIAEYLHWSMIFWFNIPFCMLALWMTGAALKRLPQNHRPHRLDLPGAALLICATVTLLLLLNWGGTRYPWGSPDILALGAASAMFWGLLVARLLTAPEPLIPISLLSNQVVFTATLMNFFSMGVFLGLVIETPVYLQTVLRLSATDAGLCMIPLMLGSTAGATAAGRSMGRLPRYKELSAASMVLSVLALAALALWPDGLPLWLVLCLMVVISFGIGTSFPIGTINIQNAVPLHHLGTATANANFFRQIGAAICVAIFSAIALAGGIAAHVHGMPETAGAIPAAAGAATAFRWIFAAAALGTTISIAFMLAMRDRPLRDGSEVD